MPSLSILSKLEAIIERGGKSHVLLIFFLGVRKGKANRQRKESPGSGVPAPSEQLTPKQLPSESDSVCRLRQDDLAVIRSEEL